VYGIYPEHDLALLKYDAAAVKLPPVEMLKSNPPALGSFIALAHPDGSVDGFGVVSVQARSLREGDKAYLGIIMDFNAARQDGVRIDQVMPGSAAQKGGLRKGDVITALDQSEIAGAMEMRNQLQRLRPGSKIAISYTRANTQRRTTVRLGSLEDNATIRRVPRERMEQMQRMGATPSRVRTDFPSVIQSDMPIDPRDAGAPVTDLDGNVVGIAIARGSRIKSFIIPTQTIRRLLSSQPEPLDKVLASETRQKTSSGQRHRSQPRPANPNEDPMDRVRRLLRGFGR
jgi:serine protease Do